MQRESFFKLQRIARFILAAIIGTLNLASIAASCWLTQSAPFDAFLTQALAFLTTPHHIAWMRIILSDYIPFAHQLLTLIHQSDAIAAIILSSISTALLTLALSALLRFNMPKRFARAANRQAARQATRQISDLAETMQRIDMYSLPQEEYSELMREFDALYRQTLDERPRFTLSPLWSQTPHSIA